MNDIYTYTVPLFINALGGLKNILTKAEAYAQEKGIHEETFLADRLAPDMFPLVKQVQIACDNAKGATARLTGLEAPKFADTEQTFSELLVRIDKTVKFIQSVPESSFADAAGRQIKFPYFPDTNLTGLDYVREFVLPNFFFHLVTAYALVRRSGVPLGKADYLNNKNFKEL